jgi:hypothetical protein
MVTGQIVCHCGQEIPASLATAHVKPSGAKCAGIREELHKPAICLECRNGTHTSAFMDKLETIRSERGSASIRVELSGGNVSIFHGEDDTLLRYFESVPEGSWDKLWDAIGEAVTA